MTSRRGRSALLLLGLLAGTGAVAWLLARSSPPRPVAAVVRVLDLEGRPVPGAQAEARYAPGWLAADAAGEVRLPDVPVREGEAPTPEAVAAAIDVRAPYFGRRGRPPEVRAGRPGTAPEVIFRLEAHGVVRVILPVSRFEAARAWVVPDPAGGRIEALDGVEVARPGAGAAWRVYPGLDAVEVRLEGAEGMAWRRVVIPPPTPGFLREVAFVPERASPIQGVVAGDPGIGSEDLPPVSGRVEVAELLESGERRVMDAVRIASDGGFTVPYAGPGRYVLRPVLDLYESPAEVVASGGEFVEERGARARPWVRVRVEGLDEAARAGASLEALGPGGAPRLLASVRDGDVWHLALQGTEPVTLRWRTPGTDAAPPRTAQAQDVTVRERGPTDVRLEPLPAPHGRLLVRLASVPERGAVVELPGGRRRTVLPGMAPEARFPHVARGTILVRASPVPGGETVEGTAEVAADEETVLVLALPVGRPPAGGR